MIKDVDVSKNFTIKKFKKGLKLIKNKNLITHNFTIKKFKKGLKTLVD